MTVITLLEILFHPPRSHPPPIFHSTSFTCSSKNENQGLYTSFMHYCKGTYKVNSLLM